MTKRPTAAQLWLAAGHRYEDVGLWRELCEFLAGRGVVPTAELPKHLAPLLFRDPENMYVLWLREQFLMPLVHLTGRSALGGNGWRVRRSWRTCLELRREPTPERLLAWWRELEPVLHRTCIKRVDSGRKLIAYDRVSRAPLYETVPVEPYHICDLCGGIGSPDDPRDIIHRWRAEAKFSDCPLLRLHVMIRTAERQQYPEIPVPALAGLLAELGERFAQIHEEGWERYLAMIWERYPLHGPFEADRGELDQVQQHLLRAGVALHIVQVCEVWIEPTAESVREYVSYLRAEGQRLRESRPAGVVEPAAALDAEAAAELDALLV